ncbi:putative vacuolar membrane transporter for cationic amino acids [Coemansia sp. RSA 551]|nr:putative vacuolar membrane transporter for cationic amino acids [Coemansia sp. RSA 551]KAJ2555603.1 putative vacuolar membrane transporter for cationic amino acids [Coemansia sp. RSA 1878]
MFLHLLGAHRHQTLASLQGQQQYENLGAADASPGLNVVLSDVFGYVSFGCWLLVLLPQLYLNYRRKSSDGLSLGFILMWLAGDFADWFGAYVGRLLLPAILIALYFVATDIVLLAQMFCYTKSDDDIFGAGQLPEGAERPPLMTRRGRRACRFSGPENFKRRLNEYREAERDALLDRGFDERQIGAPLATYGSITPPLSAAHTHESEATLTSQVIASVRELGSAKTGKAIGMSVAVLAVLLGGGVGARALLAYYPQRVTDVVSQTFGYASAAMFFVAYIPQIAWNFTAQSTEGISSAMFAFTVLGNITYCLSILSMSTERDYLITYAPWLAGAAGTLGFEALILWQCYFYSKSRTRTDSVSSTSADNCSGTNSSSSANEDDEDTGSVVSLSRRFRRRRRRHTHQPSIGAASLSRSRVRAPRIVIDDHTK